MLKQQPQRLTKATQLTKTCRQLQIKQINTIPTRKNKLLDPILTNKSDSKVYKCTNKNIFNSDHDLVLAKPIFKLHKQRQPKKKTITTRTDKMEDTINERGKIDWNELINTNNDPQSKLNVFYNTIDDIRKTCQPIKTVKTRNEKEWMTPNIKLLIKQRQKAYRQNTVDEWRRLANSIRYNIRCRKENFYSQFTKNDSKKSWATVNNLNGKSKSKQEFNLSVDQLNIGFYQT